MGTLLLLLAVPVYGQFVELATTDDGTQIYFSSIMLLKGREGTNWLESRVYRCAAGNVALYAERGNLAPESSVASGDGVASPSVSGDGAMVAVSYTNICNDTECSAPFSKVELRGVDTLVLPPGQPQISRNGRWALITGSFFLDATSTLVDLSSGQQTTAHLDAPNARSIGVSVRRLASDGSFLGTTYTQLTPNTYRTDAGIWRQGQFTTLSLPPGLSAFGLTDDGRTVLAYGYSGDDRPMQDRIVSVALGSNTVTAIVETKSAGQVPYFLGASNDARRALYLISSGTAPSGLAYIWDAASGAATPIPLDPGELANGGVMSGNGAVAFVATTRGRIVRFDVVSKAVAAMFPQTPYCDDPSPIAGGSLTRLHCSFSGSVADLQDKLTLDGTAAPVLYSTPTEIGIQAPWQRGFFYQTLSIDIPSPSPFQSLREVQTYDGAPAILSDDAGIFGMKAIKGDWTGLLTSVPPAGDIFHIYMTGLGWPQTLETTGVPASLTKPNPISWKLGCQFLPGQEPVPLLFAGLAPGMLGIYQTTFRMPDGVVRPTGFQCTIQSPAMGATFSPGSPGPGIYGSGGVIVVPAGH
jgi:uncharacterized protein (TIGR03437 family)